MKIKIGITIILQLLYLATGLGQSAKEHKKSSFVDTLGRYYQQASLPMYIFIATSPEEAPTVLAPAKEGKSNYEIKPVYLDGHGVHHLNHHDGTTGQNYSYSVNADGIAPVCTSFFINAPEYFNGKRKFYGEKLSTHINSKDEMSGVNAMYHSVNQQNFTRYSPVNFSEEGVYSYSYYAVDNVGNEEKVNTRQFTVDLSAPVTNHHIIGISSENVISTNTVFYLTKLDSLSGVSKTYYHFDKQGDIPYISGNIIFSSLKDGEHSITYYSVDNVKNKEKETTINFYLDKTAPIMSADVLGDRFIVEDKVYFSGRTKLKLTAIDNKSGVKELMYSVDESKYNRYDEPFYLPGKAGLHTVKYYAVDNTSNTEKDQYKHSVGLIYVDLTGPSLQNQFEGPRFKKGDTIYISTETKINLTGFDPESGLHHIAYSLDKEVKETSYHKSFSIDTPGLHVVDYYGYDNVNNRNVKQFTFVVDNTGPEIIENFSVLPQNNESTYPSYVALYFANTDSQTGGGEIYYSINGSTELLYTSSLKGFEKSKEYSIKIKALDKLGNKSVKEIHFRTGLY